MANTSKPREETTPKVETEDITEKGGVLGVAPDQPLNQADSDGANVEYKGRATMRRITAAQWEAAGVTGQRPVEWNRNNRYKVPVSHFTEAALNVLRADGSFLVPQR